MFKRPLLSRGVCCFALLTTAQIFAPIVRADLVDGLTAYYDFDDNLIDQADALDGSASTVADNLEYVSGHPGTFGPGLFGAAGYEGFGVGGGHAETPSSVDNNGTGDAITVSWWGRTPGFTTSWQAGVAKGEGNNWRFHRNSGDDTIAWQGGGGDIQNTGININDGEWHHFVGTKDPVAGRVLYIDGTQAATGPAGTALAIDDSLPMMVGENPGANNREWIGDIDDVAIWNRPLGSDEVTEIFEAGQAGSSLGDLLGPPTDSDNDGLLDTWEMDNLPDGAHLDDGSVNPDFGASGDPDDDGLTNLEEQAARTDPQDDDSDGDGLKDGVEDDGGTFVSADMTGTNPRRADTDGDGLNDGVEDNGGTFVSMSMTGTDPTNPDTDGDGTDDGLEAADPNRDPNVADVPIPSGVADGLTAYYNFDGNLLDQAHALSGTSSTVADDLAYASGHPGTFGEGLFGDGGYLGLGVGGGHAETPSSVDNNGSGDAITVSWWGKTPGFTTSWQAGVAKGEGNNWRFHRNSGDDTIAWQGGGGDIQNTAININDGEWHHYVGTKDPGTGRVLYIDGVEVATGPAGTPLAVDDSLPMMVGENPGANNREWIGDIDDVAIWNRPLTAEEVAGITAAGLAGQSLGDLIAPPASRLNLNVRLVGEELEISWDSEAGNLYDLLSETPDNLSATNPPEDWVAFADQVMIAATPPRNSLTIPLPGDPERYFAIRCYPPPPVDVFVDNFESGQGGWMIVTDGPGATEWELGVPDPTVIGGPPAAGDGDAVFGTDLDSSYEEDTLTSLRSPAIDLSGVVSAEVSYLQWRDIEMTFDFGILRVLDASDLSQELAVLVDTVEGTSSDWEEESHSLPAEALGKTVIFEFVLDSDDFNTSPQAGWYLDGFRVVGVPN